MSIASFQLATALFTATALHPVPVQSSYLDLSTSPTHELHTLPEDFPTFTANIPPTALPHLELGLPSATALLQGRAPDGDTLGLDFKSSGYFTGKVKNTCRYLNIDTRESHYEDYSQGLMADRQTDMNLILIGLEYVNWSHDRGTIVSTRPENLSVRVLVNGKDRYNRVLGMPLKHDADIDNLINDGGKIEWNDPNFAELIKATVNYELALQGMAYATFYKGVSPVEIAMFTSAALYARANSLGMFAEGEDLTETGIYVRTIRDLTDKEAKIHPVLFRRLTSYLKQTRKFTPEGFNNYLRRNPNPLRKLKKDYTEADLEELRSMQVEDMIEDQEYFFHDLIECEPSNDGFIVRLKEPLEHYIRW